MSGSSNVPAHTIHLVQNDPPPAEEEAAYRPWGCARSGEKPGFLDLRRADGTGEMIAYPYIMRVIYSGDSMISLLCVGGHSITIEGRGLCQLAKRLQHNDVTFIQQFSVLLWDDDCHHKDVVTLIK